MVAHTCHALNCETPCKPEHLMCWPCWRQVPRRIQHKVWNTYRAGQEDGSGPTPSEAWHQAADEAIKAVAVKEGLI